MCGRYTLRLTLTQLAEVFDILRDSGLQLAMRFNVAPTQTMPVVRLDSDRARRLDLLRWGLVPRWAKDAKTSLFNARAETIAEKPSFKTAFQQRRCLVPADGFYEWQKRPEGKQPYFIRLQGNQPFAFAGVWETWKDSDGKPHDSYAIVTTAANELMRPLHDRMPVILGDANEYKRWLTAPDQELLRSYPSERMIASPVSPIVNSARNDVPECILPLSEEHSKQRGL